MRHEQRILEQFPSSTRITSHNIAAVGLALSVIGAVPLYSVARAAADPAWIFGVTAYVVPLVAFYASSTLNHSLFLTDASRGEVRREMGTDARVGTPERLSVCVLISFSSE